MRINATPPFTALAVAAAFLALAAAPAMAASSAASAASDSIGTLSGSVSGSLQRSSDSSTKKNVAQGEYRVVEVAAVEQQPGMLRLTLQALASDSAEEALWLTLPAKAFERSGLGLGQLVAATTRPYGLEFARADTREAFFLLLADDWAQELATRPVV